MNAFQYKEAVNKAYQCGTAKYPLHKAQNTLKEQYGADLDIPPNYKGLTIIDAYMKGYQA
jgi:phosphopantetheinyl transferase (holo-ACP synthase)